MLPISHAARALIVSLVVLAANNLPAQGETQQGRFYHAYYLEHSKHDFAAAAELYGDVIAARGIPAELQREAQARLAVCREELATADFARLMPPMPLAYVELNRPGERLGKLIDQLGLLADPDGGPPTGENRLAISPAVIDAALGMRGLALAITGFDPAAQQPSGVLVLHPGDMELVRGLIETALPVSSNPADPIRGYPTFEIEGFYVTLTARLVIGGSSTAEIAGVIDRMKSPHEDSLATNAEMAELLGERDGALLFFCVNPKPLMPLMHGMMAAAATQSRELALAQALLDIPSFQSLSGRFDISDQGLLLELTLRLDKNHRNLVYNFLRRPAIDEETLRCIPPDAAAFIAMAMNDAPSSYQSLPRYPNDEPPVVTALDFGRELFANINGIAVYALPPAKSGRSGGKIPDIAAVITVNDPSQSQAIWNQMLGIASVAAGAPTMDGIAHEVAGVPVRSYRFEGDITVYVAAMGHNLFVASTEAALTHSIQTNRSGKSILNDPTFATPLAQLGEHTTLALFAHPGRCAEIAEPFMSPQEVAEMEPVTSLMTDTVVFATVQHSDRVLRMSAALTGVPDVSGLVTKLLAEERRGERSRSLASKFKKLAVHKRDRAAAVALGDELFAQMHDDAQALNNFAWALLTEDHYEHQYNDVALRFSRRCNEISNHSAWAYVDTLALAEFDTGNPQRAIELEEKAIKLCQESGGGSVEELQEALARFREAEPGG